MSRTTNTILDRLYHHAEDAPDRLAYKFLTSAGEPDTLTYGQLDARVRTLAAWLGQLAEPGDRALLLYPAGLEFVAAFLACLAAGVVAVPAYPPRKNRSVDRLVAIVRDCAPRLVLTTQEAAPSIGPELLAGEGNLVCLSTDGFVTSPTRGWQPPALDPGRPAFLQYTSGSTGDPRGVVVTHKNIVSNEEAIRGSFRHAADSVMVSWLPMFHDMGLIGGVLQPLYVGFPSVLLSPAAFLQEPARWLRAISDHRGTTTGAPNFAWDHCARRVTEEEKDGLDLGGLRVAYNGAEPVRPATLDRFASAFARCGFRPEAFFPCYGLAESTLFVSGGPPLREPVRATVSGRMLEAHAWVPASGAPTGDDRCLVGSGRVAAGSRVEIVHPETRRRCGPGEVGEVWVASDSVAAGYWNRPDETRDVLRAVLAGTGEGPFLRTGDLGFLDGGELFITGRLKDLIIIRGRNLYPQDVEAAVERALPFVKANGCAAFATTVDGEERLAVVAEADRDTVRTAQAAEKEGPPAGGGLPDRSAVARLNAMVRRVREAVAEEFEVPVHAVAFLRPGAFPRTSSGKVQRRACRDGLRAGSLDLVHAWRSRGSTDQPQRPPGNPPEEQGGRPLPGVGTTAENPAPRPDSGGAEVGAPVRQDANNPDRGADRAVAENDHLRRGQRRHALLILLGPLVGMAALAVPLWGALVTPLGIGLLVAMYLFTFVGITVGFHRLFTHNAFRTGPVLRVVLGVGGSMAGEAPLIYWVATHRKHHQHSDDDGDPHSPHLHGGGYWGSLRGWWHAHAGWMLRHDTTNTGRYARDLLRDPAMRAINGLYLWLVLLGLALPAAIGGLVTWSWVGACQGLFWGGFLRIFLAHHFTWSVNSICHLCGRHELDTGDRSVNNAWLALPTLGESWHNNHHAAPTAASFSREWWQVDLGGVVIRCLEWLRLAWDVNRPALGLAGRSRKEHRSPDSPEAQPVGETARRDPPNSMLEMKRAIRDAVLRWVRTEVDNTAETIRDDAPLIEIGIDSVGAAVIAGDVAKATGVTVGMGWLYEHGTINHLAAHLVVSASPPRETEGPAPPSQGPPEPCVPPAPCIGMLSDLLDRTSRQIERGQVAPAIEALCQALNYLYRQARRDGLIAEYKATCLGHPLAGLLLQDPYTRRALEKPRGYPGDAVMLDYVYDRVAPEGTSAMGRAVFQATTGLPNARSVVDRRDRIAHLIDELAGTFERPVVLAVAAGHLPEARQSLAVRERRVGAFYALDQDARSLAVVEREYPGQVRTVRQPIASILAGKVDLSGLHLVYASGLFDYLSDEVARRLTVALFGMLRPGGRLLVANFAPDSHGRGYMAGFMDWDLIYRDEDQMDSLAREIPHDMLTARMFRDPWRNIVYLELERAR